MGTPLFACYLADAMYGREQAPEPPGPLRGKRRGVTKSPRRPKRRNRRKP